MKKLLNTLYVLQPDRYLSLDGENVVIQEHHQIIVRVPLHNIESIYCFGSAGVSPALMGKCASYGKAIVFLERSGKFLCRCEGERSGNVLLRREQYRIADDPVRSLDIARNLIVGKFSMASTFCIGWCVIMPCGSIQKNSGIRSLCWIKL